MRTATLRQRGQDEKPRGDGRYALDEEPARDHAWTPVCRARRFAETGVILRAGAARGRGVAGDAGSNRYEGRRPAVPCPPPTAPQAGRRVNVTPASAWRPAVAPQRFAMRPNVGMRHCAPLGARRDRPASSRGRPRPPDRLQSRTGARFAIADRGPVGAHLAAPPRGRSRPAGAWPPPAEQRAARRAETARLVQPGGQWR
jgi:hypothetical protein